jgi:hypothetical protein
VYSVYGRGGLVVTTFEFDAIRSWLELGVWVTGGTDEGVDGTFEEDTRGGEDA